MLGRVIKESKEKKHSLGSEETKETIWSECVGNKNKTMSIS